MLSLGIISSISRHLCGFLFVDVNSGWDALIFYKGSFIHENKDI